VVEIEGSDRLLDATRAELRDRRGGGSSTEVDRVSRDQVVGRVADLIELRKDALAMTCDDLMVSVAGVACGLRDEDGGAGRSIRRDLSLDFGRLCRGRRVRDYEEWRGEFEGCL
jgi:hypothetical protein